MKMVLSYNPMDSRLDIESGDLIVSFSAFPMSSLLARDAITAQMLADGMRSLILMMAERGDK